MTSNQIIELPNILNISDDYTYAAFYHNYFDTGKYIYSTHTGAWFCYDEDNVLQAIVDENAIQAQERNL